MNTAPDRLRMVELSGAEALWLLAGADLVPRQATFAPSQRPARSPTASRAWEVPPLAAPAEDPSTSSTRASGRHAESTHRTPLLHGQTLPATAPGRLVHQQRELTVVRPARHVWEYGRLVARAPVRAAGVPPTATYHAEAVRAATGTGWTVTVAGPAEVITDPDEAAHYRRTLPGWTHGPHDTVVRIHPHSVTGFRLVRGTES